MYSHESTILFFPISKHLLPIRLWMNISNWYTQSVTSQCLAFGCQGDQLRYVWDKKYRLVPNTIYCQNPLPKDLYFTICNSKMILEKAAVVRIPCTMYCQMDPCQNPEGNMGRPGIPFDRCTSQMIFGK